MTSAATTPQPAEASSTSRLYRRASCFSSRASRSFSPSLLCESRAEDRFIAPPSLSLLHRLRSAVKQPSLSTSLISPSASRNRLGRHSSSPGNASALPVSPSSSPSSSSSSSSSQGERGVKSEAKREGRARRGAGRQLELQELQAHEAYRRLLCASLLPTLSAEVKSRRSGEEDLLDSSSQGVSDREAPRETAERRHTPRRAAPSSPASTPRRRVKHLLSATCSLPSKVRKRFHLLDLAGEATPESLSPSSFFADENARPASELSSRLSHSPGDPRGRPSRRRSLQEEQERQQEGEHERERERDCGEEGDSFFASPLGMATVWDECGDDRVEEPFLGSDEDSCEEEEDQSSQSAAVPQRPYRTLPAPDLLDDFYLNLVDWSRANLLAVALKSKLFLWSPQPRHFADGRQARLLFSASGTSIPLADGGEGREDGVVCVKFSPQFSSLLLVGFRSGLAEIWDVHAEKKLRSLRGHASRCTVAAWTPSQLTVATGARDQRILIRDLRLASPYVSCLTGHGSELCGLQVSPSETLLASGGNDNLLCVWDFRSLPFSSPVSASPVSASSVSAPATARWGTVSSLFASSVSALYGAGGRLGSRDVFSERLRKPLSPLAVPASQSAGFPLSSAASLASWAAVRERQNSFLDRSYAFQASGATVPTVGSGGVSFVDSERGALGLQARPSRSQRFGLPTFSSSSTPSFPAPLPVVPRVSAWQEDPGAPEETEEREAPDAREFRIGSSSSGSAVLFSSPTAAPSGWRGSSLLRAPDSLPDTSLRLSPFQVWTSSLSLFGAEERCPFEREANDAGTRGRGLFSLPETHAGFETTLSSHMSSPFVSTVPAASALLSDRTRQLFSPSLGTGAVASPYGSPFTAGGGSSSSRQLFAAPGRSRSTERDRTLSAFSSLPAPVPPVAPAFGDTLFSGRERRETLRPAGTLGLATSARSFPGAQLAPAPGAPRRGAPRDARPGAGALARDKRDRSRSTPLFAYEEHSAAVKAVAWSPHASGLLASGGGTADRHVRFWNTNVATTSSVHRFDVGCQVCNLCFSPHSEELLSTHGFSLNQVFVWSYSPRLLSSSAASYARPSFLASSPSSLPDASLISAFSSPCLSSAAVERPMGKTATLSGHTARVLFVAVSPCGRRAVTGAGKGDETLKFWKVFQGNAGAKHRTQGELFDGFFSRGLRASGRRSRARWAGNRETDENEDTEYTREQEEEDIDAWR
ncbi:WD domain, G-beta repeat-containing protein [Toxoplasma gondii RUB]|uniref:WD domain, G-beta repeat-containing protein n=1 Tax=Toxoplasma gondii RUB TaxID=935652 RepID=A0A086MC42_TOXGO|nr:WD domain, G-beta repeat-containing protein [Toxoplasma gondii RUB]